MLRVKWAVTTVLIHSLAHKITGSP